MERETNILLRKLVQHSITLPEYRKLKASAACMSDDELAQALSEVWESYDGSAQVPESVNRAVMQLKPVTVTRFRFLRTMMKAAAVLALMASIGTGIYLYQDNASMKALLRKQLTVQVESGDKTLLTLPDGTKVFLNASTSLSYPSDFGQAHRDIYLSGEAYLEVAKDARRPFRVHTKHIDIQVLGTKFNISAYPDNEQVETMLMEGSVEVTTTDTRHTLTLRPHEKAVYDLSGDSLTVSPATGEFETAWMRGELAFRSARLSEIMRQLERRYGKEIKMSDNRYDTDLFTGHFEEDNIYAVLKILQMHYPFTYEEHDGKIYIRNN